MVLRLGTAAARSSLKTHPLFGYLSDLKPIVAHRVTNVSSVRLLRTLRARPELIIDIEDQLKSYPAHTRKEIIETITSSHSAPPKDTASVNRNNGQKIDHSDRKPKQVDREKYLANLIEEFLTRAESSSELDFAFWQTVKQFARSFISSRTGSSHLDLFGKLFEAAKSIENPSLRQQMIYEVGRFIYRQKKVRLDSVNEVEFLDSLVANNRAFSALKLWESRKNRPEVRDSDYWLENGVLFYIDAGLVNHANQLALSFKSSGKCAAALIGAWAKMLRSGRNVELCKQWITHWVAVLGDIGEEYVENAFGSLISARQWTLASQLLSKMPNIDSKNLVRCLNISAKVVSKSEDSFINFLEILLMRSAHFANSGSVGGSLALSIARSGDYTGAQQIIEDLKSQNVVLPPVFKHEIVKSLISSHHSAVDESVLKFLVTGPAIMNQVLKEPKNGLKNILQSYLDNKYPINSSLAYQMMKSGMVDIEVLVPLAKDSKTWSYIWYFAAKNRSVDNPSFLLEKMIDSGFVISAQQLVYICVAYTTHARSTREGINELCKQLATHQPACKTSPLIAALFVKITKRLLANYKLPIIRPQHEMTFSDYTEIPWSMVTEKVRKQ